MKTKTCTKCHTEKSLSEFYKNKMGKFGVRAICIKCLKSPNVKRKLERFVLGLKLCSLCDKEKSITSFNKDISKNDKLSNICRECQKEYIKFWNIKNKYNLTSEQYYELFKIQNNKCLICKKKAILVVDHDHKTRKIRGLLCRECNLGIGLLKDNITILKTAIKYLEKR